jgi:hypothetical protein
MVVTPVSTVEEALAAIEAFTAGESDSLPRCEA